MIENTNNHCDCEQGCNCSHENCNHENCDCGHEECDCHDDCDELYNKDGLDNKEHILDMNEEIEMLFQNIKDNTDSAFSLIKTYESVGDEDLVDVVKINASEILEIEKEATNIYQEINKMIFSFKNIDEEINNKKINIFNHYFEKIKEYEKKSSDIFNKLIIKLK